MTRRAAAGRAIVDDPPGRMLTAVAEEAAVAARRPPTASDWRELVDAAWHAGTHAMARNTSVGAAVLAAGGQIYAGCNVEHKLRCHDVHAEINALSSMVAGGGRQAIAVLVVSAGRRLTPCGGCMDWIFQLGGAQCLVAWQGARDDELAPLRADELMPYYPY